MKCPHCGSENTRPHGKTTSGKPRCLCRDCKKTFSLSGLPSGGQLKGRVVMSDAERSRLYRARRKALKDVQEGDAVIRKKLTGNLQKIAIAAYQGHLDGVDTAWVANQYGVPHKKALRVLKEIVSGGIYDAELYPFGDFDESMGGVIIGDGTTFTYGDNAEYQEGLRGFNHYLWFTN